MHSSIIKAEVVVFARPLCGDCAYTEEYPVAACSWLYRDIPPEGAKVAKLPWVGDGKLYDYIVECPQFKPLKKRSR